MYNKEIFDGDQKDFQNKRKKLHSIYLKYEEDTSIMKILESRK